MRAIFNFLAINDTQSITLDREDTAMQNTQLNPAKYTSSHVYIEGWRVRVVAVALRLHPCAE